MLSIENKKAKIEKKIVAVICRAEIAAKAKPKGRLYY
jgi:hypothetical protein